MKRHFPTLLLTGAALLGSATALPAAAQFAKPEDAIKAAVGDTGKACKACHDNYRKE